MQSGSEAYSVLDVWCHIEPRFGGLGPAAAALAGAVERHPDWRSNLIAVCDATESERHKAIPDSVNIVIQRSFRPIADLHLKRALESAISKAQVCHVHGIWLAHSLAATRIARQMGKPVVCSAHGMLEKWDLANKRLKKQIYSAVLERPSLRRSSCLRALSEQEAIDYRAFGLKNPIAIVPNGVGELSKVDASNFLAEFPQLSGKRIVLFLGRIHRKKGILDLLRAWPDVVRRHSDAHLLIAGADYDHTRAAATQIVADFKMQNSVTFCGVLSGNTKLGALSIATVFCLPSYSEGMSIAVLEALSIGLPVVISRACNVGGVAESGAGYITSTDCRAISDSLCDCLMMNGIQLNSMRESARLLARSKYTWSQSAEAMRSVYKWLLGGSKPDCVTA